MRRTRTSYWFGWNRAKAWKRYQKKQRGHWYCYSACYSFFTVLGVRMMKVTRYERWED
jgi:hypothetical protein